MEITNEILEDEGGEYRLVYVFPRYIKEYIIPNDANFTKDERSSGGQSLYRLLGKDWRRKSGYEITVNASDFPTMAHLMHHLGTFKSISEARRNGHAGPVVPGVRMLRVCGYMHRVVIE